MEPDGIAIRSSLITRPEMDEQESTFSGNLVPSHYNLYDGETSENKPFNDVNGMLQQIMSIVDQSLDEAQSRFAFSFVETVEHDGFSLENTRSIKVV